MTALIRACLVAALALGAGAVACELKHLPTAPDELVDGIVVYEEANYRGRSAHITSDIADLRTVDGPCAHSDSERGTYLDWNDCISSVKVAPGWQATLYRDDNYRDDERTTTVDLPNLQLVSEHDCPHDGLNDCVTSIRVRRQ
jgi:hypothetical protein